MKYKVGVEYTLRGTIYLTVEAANEEEAEKQAEAIAEDAVMNDLDNAALETEVCDIITVPKEVA